MLEDIRNVSKLGFFSVRTSTTTYVTCVQTREMNTKYISRIHSPIQVNPVAEVLDARDLREMN